MINIKPVEHVSCLESQHLICQAVSNLGTLDGEVESRFVVLKAGQERGTDLLLVSCRQSFGLKPS
jgi:hypothetical protein